MKDKTTDRVIFKKEPNKKQEIINILNPTIKKWFFSRFKEFSLPQLYGVLEIHSRNNVLISAPTGATKTLTAFLSILNELVDSSEKGILEDRIYCVYISPLKALNYDIEVNLKGPLKEIEEISKRNPNIRIAVRTGDTTQSERSKMLKKPPHILITTPESLAILLSTRKFVEHLKNVEWVIIDEIHSLAENKRGTHLSLSLERLQRLNPGICRIGLSATIAPIDEVARFLVGYEDPENRIERPCKIIDVKFLKKMDLKVLSPVKDLIDSTYENMHSSTYKLIHDLIQKHKTTLIFTNTRSATERVVHNLKEMFPKKYIENIGAHHSSLSKYKRREVEDMLRKGKLKVVVSSTSLELGIDIGYIDLVILLGSPKSVARALQRIGRSGHRMHEITKGRIIVLDRDDLVECSVLLKDAVEKKIDKIHIPKNCLDVLAQHIYGIAISGKIEKKELFNMIRKSYSYNTLNKQDFDNVLKYLSGGYTSLEERNVYAKIWEDEKYIGRRGRLARMLYMTNIGTIPEESYITVKVKKGNKEEIVGKIDESFLERLQKRDVFVLGGDKYEFLHTKGMNAYVNASVYRPPTIPSWFSEMLPLSFDLALDIGKLRRLIEEKMSMNMKKQDIIKFINNYLYIDKKGAEALYKYFKEQYDFSEIPTDKKIIIEYFEDKGRKYAVFHTLFGRRVNDALSRLVAYVISKIQKRDVEIGITDNGFYVASEKPIQALRAFNMLKSEKLDLILRAAIEKTELLKRRFRHCASRALMILRTYKGRTKTVMKQQRLSQILFNSVKRIDSDFPVLKEARREVFEDVFDIENTKKVIKWIEEGKIKIKENFNVLPSPFAFIIVMRAHLDLLKIEDKIEFLKRMHNLVLATIALRKKKRQI